MHAGNCKNVAHSASAESGYNFVFKFSPGSDKKLFQKRCMPIDKKSVNYGRDFFAYKVNEISEGRMFFPDNLNGRICISMNGNFSGTVSKNIA